MIAMRAIRKHLRPVDGSPPPWTIRRMWLPMGAAALITLCVLALPSWLHVVVLPFALFAPGYALLAVIFGRESGADPFPAAALCLLLSLAAYALLGLALNTLSIRISPDSVVAGTDCLILALAALSAWENLPRRGSDGGPAPSPEDMRPMQHRLPLDHPSTTRDRKSSPFSWAAHGWAVGYALALALSGIVLIVVLHGTPKPANPPFTQFYLAGSWAHTSGIVEARAGHALAVRVGITNHTRQTQTYTLQPALDGTTRWAVQEVRLPAGRAWSGILRGPVTMDNCLHRLVIQLGTARNSSVASSLVLWVRGRSAVAPACAAGHG